MLNPTVGARIGASSGLALGVWLLIASVIQGLLAPVFGQPTVNVPESLLYGVSALVVATLAGGVM
ncbi:MAG TPA: branched-chain amino acid ABC transporter permease, partial [Cyanobacteria bacterium UBA8553]|nr:branched-chain amino acid ABC transporter permease [Cyanobacteria bacterium UBA8553]